VQIKEAVGGDIQLKEEKWKSSTASALRLMENLRGTCCHYTIMQVGLPFDSCSLSYYTWCKNSTFSSSSGSPSYSIRRLPLHSAF
jgi:hypothetical protein